MIDLRYYFYMNKLADECVAVLSSEHVFNIAKLYYNYKFFFLRDFNATFLLYARSIKIFLSSDAQRLFDGLGHYLSCIKQSSKKYFLLGCFCQLLMKKKGNALVFIFATSEISKETCLKIKSVFSHYGFSSYYDYLYVRRPSLIFGFQAICNLMRIESSYQRILRDVITYNMEQQ